MVTGTVGPEPDAGEAPVGTRLARRQAQRRRRRRIALAAGVAIALAALLAAALTRLGGQPAGEDQRRQADGAAPGPTQQTLLLVRQPQSGGAAKGVTLLVAGPEEGDGSIVFLPVGVLADIPGYGMDRLGMAHRYGGGPLLQAAVSNAFGITVDHVAVTSDVGLAALLSRIGTVEVDVPERLVARETGQDPSLRFAAGPQDLDGPRLVEYLSFRQSTEDELETFPRQEQVWQAVLSAFTGQDGDERLDALLQGGAPQLDTQAPQAWLRSLLATLAAAQEQGRLRQALLPVEAFGGPGPDGGATYRVRQDEVEAFWAQILAPAQEQSADVLRVEVLNGVGVPGVGQAVHGRLRGGFRIVRTDNARSFDFTETQILVYDEAHLPAARRLRDLLGVGTISVSKRPQTVVDLTVVVGADFTDREGTES